jgi:hypothetical protein
MSHFFAFGWLKAAKRRLDGSSKSRSAGKGPQWFALFAAVALPLFLSAPAEAGFLPTDFSAETLGSERSSQPHPVAKPSSAHAPARAVLDSFFAELGDNLEADTLRRQPGLDDVFGLFSTSLLTVSDSVFSGNLPDNIFGRYTDKGGNTFG